MTPRPQPGLRGAAIVVSAVLAILVDQTSTAIINTGLPYLQGATAATPDEGSWIITVFNAAYYSFILFSPWLMAKFGKKDLMVGALCGFSLTSLVLANVNAFGPFLALRFVQGAFLGCIFVPAAVLLFTSLDVRLLKFAPPAFVFVSLAGSTIGTVIGGFFADEFGAGAVFVPGCLSTLVTAALIFVAVRTKDAVRHELPFDVLGLALSVLSFGAMQFLANEGERRNWFEDPSIVLGALVLAGALPTFICYELFLTRNPHVNFRMFAQHRNLAVGALVNVTIGAVGYSVTMLVGYLQAVIGATATAAGAIVLIRVVTYVVGVPAAFFLIASKWLDLRAVVICGVAGSALGLLVFAAKMTPTAELQTFALVSLLFGLFFGMLNQPIGSLVLGSLPLPLLPSGVSVYKLSSPLGLMIATGAMQALLDRRAAQSWSDLSGTMTPARGPVAAYVSAHHGAGGLVSIVAAQARALSYAHVMPVFAGVLLVVVPLVFLVRIPKPKPEAARV